MTWVVVFVAVGIGLWRLLRRTDQVVVPPQPSVDSRFYPRPLSVRFKPAVRELEVPSVMPAASSANLRVLDVEIVFFKPTVQHDDEPDTIPIARDEDAPFELRREGTVITSAPDPRRR